MVKHRYFLTHIHAIDVGEKVARALGKTAVFSTHRRKSDTCPEHYVAIVQCRHVTVRCFREDYFEAQFCDSTNSCTSTRATSWEEALRELRAQLVLMRDGYQEGIEILESHKPIARRINADQMHRICMEGSRHLDKYKVMADEVNKLIGRAP